MVNKTKKQKQRQKQALGQAQQVADKPAPGASTQGNQPLPISPDELASGLSTLMITQKPARVNIVQAWDDYFGQGTLEDWARLCRDLGLEGDFSSKTKCKKAMKNVWINIPDFLLAPDKNEVTRFPSEAALSQYTMKNRSRRYPKLKIGKDSPLRLLMANILSPWYWGKRNGKA